MISREIAEEFSRHIKEATISLQRALDVLGSPRRIRSSVHSGLAHVVRDVVLRISNIRKIYPSYLQDDDLEDKTLGGWNAKFQILSNRAEDTLMEMETLLRNPRFQDVDRARQARLETERAYSALQEVILKFSKISQPQSEIKVVSRKKRQEKRR